MRILFLSRWFPYPANNGSKLRIANLLQSLASHHEVCLLSFSDDPQTDAQNQEIKRICAEVVVVPWKPYNPKSIKAFTGFFEPKPRSLSDTFSREMSDAISGTISTSKIDAVIASSITMASYAPFFKRIPALFEEIELGVPYEAASVSSSFRERLRNWFTWLKLKGYLRQLLRFFKASVVVSEREREIFVSEFLEYSNIHVFPNCIDFEQYQNIKGNPAKGSMIFTGSFHYEPNHDAMVWFTKEVLPKIVLKYPQVKLAITGDHAGKSLPDMENVSLMGYVDDIKPLVANSWCSIAPLRYGGGTRLKILEAMALQTPVVATTKGAEGLDLIDGVHLLIADTPDEFSNAVIKLFTDVDLRNSLVNKAYHAVKEKYDWSRIQINYLRLVDSLYQDE